LRSPQKSAPAWVDGELTTVANVQLGIDDPTVLAGLGLFETFSVQERRVLDLELHLKRLTVGRGRLGLTAPGTERMREYILTAAQRLAFPAGWIKLILTAGGSCIVFGSVLSDEPQPETASAVLLPWQRNLIDPLTGLKTLNYAANLLGLEEARKRGADEGLWLNTRGHLAEGCWSNVFVVCGRKLFTPGVREGILPGILRGLVLDVARKSGVAVHEGKVRLRRLEQAREAFLTSSLAGVRPLVRYNGRPIGRASPGPMTLQLRSEVRRVRLASGALTGATDPPEGVGRGLDAVPASPRRER
jgi:branched-chain amino acid aminotransferase